MEGTSTGFGTFHVETAVEILIQTGGCLFARLSQACYKDYGRITVGDLQVALLTYFLQLSSVFLF
jgi:hypothetical protein